MMCEDDSDDVMDAIDQQLLEAIMNTEEANVVETGKGISDSGATKPVIGRETWNA